MTENPHPEELEESDDVKAVEEAITSKSVRTTCRVLEKLSNIPLGPFEKQMKVTNLSFLYYLERQLQLKKGELHRVRAASLKWLDSFEEVKRSRKQRDRQRRRDGRLAVRNKTGIRSARQRAIDHAKEISNLPRIEAGENEEVKVEVAEEQETQENKRGYRCYICKKLYLVVHHFYDALCIECADFNFGKRQQTRDLSGQVALVTGVRIKIGYEVALKLLRANAHVIGTTRFPQNALDRFKKEVDYPKWKDRLDLYAVDLRLMPKLALFCGYIKERYNQVDILINNAAQTVRRPPMFYKHLLAEETKSNQTAGIIQWEKSGESATLRIEESSTPAILLEKSMEQSLTPLTQLTPLATSLTTLAPLTSESKVYPTSVVASQLCLDDSDWKVSGVEFPVDCYDKDLQQLDLRKTNSWMLPITDISPWEWLETHVINVIAPAMLIRYLVPCMSRSYDKHSYIINVSAMEGCFYRLNKTANHVQTNAAKAALNMIVRTSSSQLLRDHRIKMYSVDTGWCSNEKPISATSTREFHPPVDEIDGASRILDPIFQPRDEVGVFYKDYKSHPW